AAATVYAMAKRPIRTAAATAGRVSQAACAALRVTAAAASATTARAPSPPATTAFRTATKPASIAAAGRVTSALLATLALRRATADRACVPSNCVWMQPVPTA